MLRRTLPVVAAVALAACSGGREVPPETPAEQEVPSLAASENGAPGENTATASAENAIPDRFIGVWDYIRGTCDPASDMRLEIEQDKLANDPGEKTQNALVTLAILADDWIRVCRGLHGQPTKIGWVCCCLFLHEVMVACRSGEVKLSELH